jgi:rod shape determining protein RodA
MVAQTEPRRTSFDPLLFLLLAVLLCIGIAMVYSATFDEVGKHWLKQLVFALVGMVGLAGMLLVSPRIFYGGAYPFYFISQLPLLYIILFKADSVERWIALPGGFNLQPSELAKVALLLAMARLLSNRPVSLSDPQTLIAPFLLFIIPFLLVLNQPNLSTALSFVAMSGCMAFFSGLAIRDIFLLASPVLSTVLAFNDWAWGGLFLVLVIVMLVSRTNIKAFLLFISVNIAAGYGAIFAWNRILYEHQRGRILTFLDPQRDPQGAGYQVLQSKVAVGSGELFGKGYLNGTQTNLSFLPEEHTDFIFSVLGEQFGFLGCALLMVLYFAFIQRILRIGTLSRSRFTSLVAVGTAGIFGFHILVNISMTIGMMPVTGLPLPFLSYGGSFLISCLIMLGVLISLDIHGDYI